VSPSSTTFDEYFTLQRRHVRESADFNGIVISIKKSKGDRLNAGTDVQLPWTGDSLCVVSAIRRYLADRPDVDGSPLRPFLVHTSGKFVTRDNVSQALKRHCVACGLDPSRVASHSLRIGACYAMANDGVPTQTIQALGRWAASTAPAMALLYCRMSLSRVETAHAAMMYDPGEGRDIPLYTPVLAKRARAAAVLARVVPV